MPPPWQYDNTVGYTADVRNWKPGSEEVVSPKSTQGQLCGACNMMFPHGVAAVCASRGRALC